MRKHWSNKAKTTALVNKIIYPYVTKFKEELGLPETQKILLAWDVFKAQSTDNVLSNLEKLNINVVAVPKNMTYLWQPLDLTTNASVKEMENVVSMTILHPLSLKYWRKTHKEMSAQSRWT